MKKQHYLKELKIKQALQKGSKGKDVRKVQEWLNIWRYVDTDWRHAVTIDGDFGIQTETIVKAFQKFKGMTENGQVNQNVFDAICNPMKDTFTTLTGNDLRELVIRFAHQHLKNLPIELNNRNKGP